jgi:hypothetical protein
MIRLLDLHAASIAGDTLIAVGLAGTIFFAVPAGEARGRVALYLLVTMLPFALLAPVVGPVLDRFRHGRRYALATTFLGRAFLAYLISENLNDIALYPAAFGHPGALPRLRGGPQRRVPRLLPPGLALSAANARASLFGTVAGAIVAPIGIVAAAQFGQSWPLRIATVVFLYGMVTSLRLPPKADSEEPEKVPRALQRKGHKGAKVLSAPLIVASSSAPRRCARSTASSPSTWRFAVREGHLDSTSWAPRSRRPPRSRCWPWRWASGRSCPPASARCCTSAARRWCRPSASCWPPWRPPSPPGGSRCRGSRCCAWSRRWPAALPSSPSTPSCRSAPTTAPGRARSRTPRRC